MKRVLSAAIMTTTLVVCSALMVRPAVADSPTTVINAVQNTGNSSGQAAVGTTGNVNQNTNQNSLGTSSATSVNIGGITITPGSTSGSGVSGLNAAETGTGTGAGETYSGSTTFASPSVTFGNSFSRITNVNLPGLPGVLGAPGNFSQPYKPDVFINGAGPVRPARMTYEQAKECKGGYGYKDTYTGTSRDKANEITLVYAAWDKIDITNDISNYVGISSVEGADKPWLPAVCEAAYHAMDKGANYGVVEFIIRPKNTMKGFGFGSSGGGSVVPNAATAASPYGLAATLGFGMGWSSQRVEGEVMIQVTGLRVPDKPTAALVPPPAAAVPVAAPVPQQSITPAPTAPAIPPRPADDGRVIKPDSQPLKLQPEARPQSAPEQPKGDTPQQLSVPGQPSTDPAALPSNIPGQPNTSAAPAAAPVVAAPVPVPVPAPAPAAATPAPVAPAPAAAAPAPAPAAPASAPAADPAPLPLGIPGQPGVTSAPQEPAPPPQPLAVPGQPIISSAPAQSAPAPASTQPTAAPTQLSVPGQPTPISSAPQGQGTLGSASSSGGGAQVQPVSLQSKINGAGGR